MSEGVFDQLSFTPLPSRLHAPRYSYMFLFLQKRDYFWNDVCALFVNIFQHNKTHTPYKHQYRCQKQPATVQLFFFFDVTPSGQDKNVLVNFSVQIFSSQCNCLSPQKLARCSSSSLYHRSAQKHANPTKLLYQVVSSCTSGPHLSKHNCFNFQLGRRLGLYAGP